MMNTEKKLDKSTHKLYQFFSMYKKYKKIEIISATIWMQNVV
jgi:hypothetical protein